MNPNKNSSLASGEMCSSLPSAQYLARTRPDQVGESPETYQFCFTAHWVRKRNLANISFKEFQVLAIVLLGLYS
jgi:hypothetical protein